MSHGRRGAATDGTGDPGRQPQQPFRHAGAVRAVLAAGDRAASRRGGAGLFPRGLAQGLDRAPDLRRRTGRSRVAAGRGRPSGRLLEGARGRGHPDPFPGRNARNARLRRHAQSRRRLSGAPPSQACPWCRIALSGFDRILPKRAVVPLPLEAAACVGAPRFWSGDGRAFMAELAAALAGGSENSGEPIPAAA